MLQIFRTSQLLFSIFLLPLILLFRIPAFLHFQTIEPVAQGVLSPIIWADTGYSSMIAHAITVLLIWFQGILINWAANHYRLFDTPSQFPGVLLVLLYACHPSLLDLTPYVMANSFLVFGLLSVMKVYKSGSSADEIFNIGFFVGLSSCFVGPYILFVPFFVLAMNSLRAYSVKETIILICGIGSIFILMNLWFYWHDQLVSDFWQPWLNDFRFFRFKGITGFVDVAALIVFALLLGWAVSGLHNLFSKQLIAVQKRISTAFLIIMGSLMVLFFLPTISVMSISIAFIPLALLTGGKLSIMDKPWADTLFLLLSLFIIAIQCYPYYL